MLFKRVFPRIVLFDLSKNVFCPSPLYYLTSQINRLYLYLFFVLLLLFPVGCDLGCDRCISEFIFSNCYIFSRTIQKVYSLNYCIGRDSDFLITNELCILKSIVYDLTRIIIICVVEKPQVEKLAAWYVDRRIWILQWNESRLCENHGER